MKRKLSEIEIDNIVEEQARDNTAWEKPIRIRKTKSAAFSIPADLASRAAFLAKLHREPGIEEWLMRIIRERIEMEEVAFIEAKREISAKSGV